MRNICIDFFLLLASEPLASDSELTSFLFIIFGHIPVVINVLNIIIVL